MKEINAIIASYHEASAQNEQVALATVVHVEGSSYRKPGARMLVTEKGIITGAISGGCLEGDALRKALNAVVQKKSTIVTYDTTDEDVTFGVQLGCNGIVHILFEYIDYSNDNNPILLLKKAVNNNRLGAVVCTLFTLNRTDWQIGTAMVASNGQVYTNLNNAPLLINRLNKDAELAITQKTSSIRQYKINGVDYNGFVELMKPAISLIIAGAGNDAIPFVAIAKSLGWVVTLVDGRTTHANKQRFPLADKIIIGKPEDVIQQLQLDDHSALVLMTHNYNYDIDMLRMILPQKEIRYIGSLGPKKKLKRMLRELEEEGVKPDESSNSKLYGPIGLDIGADTPDEVALSIAAEVKAVMSGKEGIPLRNKNTTIHDRFDGDHLVPVHSATSLTQTVNEAIEPFSCTIQTDFSGK